MKAKFNYEMSSLSMNAAQGLTMTCGLIGGLYIAVFQVAKEGKSIGQLTTFLAYWAQLQGMIKSQNERVWMLIKYRPFSLLQQYLQKYILQLDGCRTTP
jgi:hypothetical protein